MVESEPVCKHMQDTESTAGGLAEEKRVTLSTPDSGHKSKHAADCVTGVTAPRDPVIESVPGARGVLVDFGVRASDLFRMGTGEIMRATPHRCTRRLAGRDGETYYLKVYRPGAGRIGKIDRARSPARAEWDKLLDLAAAGIPVPEAVCLVEGRRGDRDPSLILLRGIRGCVPLDELLAQGADPSRVVAWLRSELVPVVRHLHACGFQHRDLYACHVLAPTGFAGPPALIDLARVRKSAELPARRRIKDLAALCYSLSPHVGNRALLRLLLDYLELARLDRAARRLVRRVVRKSSRIARHQPRYG